MGEKKLVVFLLFSFMGIYFMFDNPAVSIELLVLSLYFLYGWMEQKGEQYSARAYLALFILLLGNGIFSLYIDSILSVGVGLLSFLLALSTWLSYQQLKIDQRKEDDE